jgi:cell wall-associated NlpC family hydrolase
MSHRRLLLAVLLATLGLAVACAPAGAHPRSWDDDPGSALTDDTAADPTPSADDLPEDPADDAGDDQADDDSGDDPLVPELPVVPVPTTKTIAGKVALVRKDGRAAIPRGAPARVRQLISAANRIIGKPYKWGGGHAALADRGYDCSGAVSYALIRSGLLRRTMVSGELAHWGAAGAGRWVSVYATRNHVYMEVAGLRFDTSGVGDPAGRSGVRWRPVIGKRSGFHTRHPAGL